MIKPELDWLDRKCRNCGKVKPLNQFQKANNCDLGYRYRCKACANKLVMEVYDKDPHKKLTKNETYRQKNWDKIREKTYAYRKTVPVKVRANQAVNNAIAAGKLTKLPCFTCNRTRADFHHTHGYDKEHWFTGIWLCRKHHLELHKIQRRALNAVT